MSKSGDDYDDDHRPQVSPTDETDAPYDAAFVAQCLSRLDVLSTMGPSRPDAQLLTWNDHVGLVFRVDFTIGNRSSPGLVDRMVCWKTDDGAIATMFAIGQDVPPLGGGDNGV